MFQRHIGFIDRNGALQETAFIRFAFLDIVAIQYIGHILRGNPVAVSDDVDIIIAFEFIEQLTR